MNEKVNPMKIVTAGLIDALLTIGFCLALFSFFPKITENINPSLCVFFGLIIYRFITILFFNSTLGMKVFNLIFLSGDQENLNIKEKVLASFFILFQGVDYYDMLEAID